MSTFTKGFFKVFEKKVVIDYNLIINRSIYNGGSYETKYYYDDFTR